MFPQLTRLLIYLQNQCPRLPYLTFATNCAFNLGSVCGGIVATYSPLLAIIVSLSHKSWSDKEELQSNKDDYTHRHIKGNMVGDKDFLGVTNSYVNDSSTDKGTPAR
jgi:hypothetical protein